MFARHAARLGSRCSTHGCSHNRNCERMIKQVHVQHRSWSLFRSKVTTNPSKEAALVSSKVSADGGALSENAVAHPKQQVQKPPQKQKKTMAQIDEELRLAMEGRAGDGGESGLELEDGKAVSMKRGVRENMFRYI